jgi:phosphohistidine swiveling domain-containing protein
VDPQKQNRIIPLNGKTALDGRFVGGKAASLAKLISTGMQVPPGFCLTVAAYQAFITASNLTGIIQMELGRKSLQKMRWEEIWDSALRIRSAFLRAPFPPSLVKAIGEALLQLNSQYPLAVRSSALGEDSANRSFAGLHESIVNVQGEESVVRAIRKVWASLWSDAALLYRRELDLDPLHSGMAIVVQEMVPAQNSGVAFSRDPRNQLADREIVEAVPGPCSNLVDGLLEPDRWILQHSSGKVLEWLAGERNTMQTKIPLLNDHDLSALHTKLSQIENLFGLPSDVEWAQQSGKLSILQARPITSGQTEPQSDERRWYLTLRLKFEQLQRLAEKVSKKLIPELESLGHQMVNETIQNLDDDALADCIETRLSKLNFWRKIYKKEFIPLAHGVRYFGAYYNDALHPENPYEFMSILENQDFLAAHRHAALLKLAQSVKENGGLLNILSENATASHSIARMSWTHLKKKIINVQDGPNFIEDFEQFLIDFMDIAYNGERLVDQQDALVHLICQLSAMANEKPIKKEKKEKNKALELEQRLIKAVGKSQEQEARKVIAIGKLSWRLRDDDNILLGRIESQFLRALAFGTERLHAAGRLTGKLANEEFATLVVQLLRNHSLNPVHLDENKPESRLSRPGNLAKPRQLIGQPASPGLAEGLACVITGAKDFLKFQRGEILVCESIQPTMTHLVPLASAIVERRGGMLIHGAIIARELGIPCVNGIPDAINVICDGDQLMVDGHLGIVTLGATDFEMEDHLVS